MTINATVFSSTGRRTMLPVTLADNATVQQALDAAGEGVPPDCELYLDGERVNTDALLPANSTGNITINRKTKGN